MILVLFLCFILFILFLIVILTMISTVKININDFEASSSKKVTFKTVEIYLEIFEKIRWIRIKLSKGKLKKVFNKINDLEKFNMKQLEKNLKLEDLKRVCVINPKISCMDLNLKVGVEDVFLTTYLVPIISIILSVLLSLAVEDKNIKNINYKVLPVYNKFFYLIKLNITFNIKVINILKCILTIYKKSRENKSKIKCNV